MSAKRHPTGFDSSISCPGGESEGVELRQFTQIRLANVLINSMVGLLHVRIYKLEGIGSGQEWEEFILLGLKIQNLWFWCTWLDFRLVPHSAVSDGNGASLGQRPSGLSYKEGADKHHGPVVIKNGGKKFLVLDCHYPEDEVGQEEEDKNDIYPSGK
ncbi:hypothetical protein GH733_013743 [Mirounga leonina]|nr:hypothetical protein GH733_013743 [Mirounga leonina]